MFEGILTTSIVGRAIGTERVDIKVHNLRDWSTDKYKSVDARPFGGGAGMVMRVDIVERAVSSLRIAETKVILLDTKGDFYNQEKAKALSESNHLILIVPHFEGIDHRVHQYIADEVVCIGPYVLSGGEIPAMVVVDSVVRLLPGVLGNEESLTDESFNEGNIREYPQYTRPAEYKEWNVPEVLLSGNHSEIEKWRKGK